MSLGSLISHGIAHDFSTVYFNKDLMDNPNYSSFRKSVESNYRKQLGLGDSGMLMIPWLDQTEYETFKVNSMERSRGTDKYQTDYLLRRFPKKVATFYSNTKKIPSEEEVSKYFGKKVKQVNGPYKRENLPESYKVYHRLGGFSERSSKDFSFFNKNKSKVDKEKKQLYEVVNDFNPQTEDEVLEVTQGLKQPNKFWKAKDEYGRSEWNSPDSIEAMKEWLRYPTELGKDPKTIEYDSTIFNKGMPYNIYRFTSDNPEHGEMWGQVNALNNDAFSSFYKYNKDTFYDEFIKQRDMLDEMHNQYRKMGYFSLGSAISHGISRDFDDEVFRKVEGDYKKYLRNEILNVDLGAKLANFSMSTAYVGPVLVDSPQYKQDPTLNYPVFKYADGTNQYHLHKDGAKVPDIIVITPYTPNDEDWKHDIDFLTEFQECSKGVPIGKYEVIYED